jgi:hypothetical protein
VNLSSNQTLTGTKTFSTAPVITPSTIRIGTFDQTFPSTAGTIVNTSSEQTLSNKTLNNPKFSVFCPSTTWANTLMANGPRVYDFGDFVIFSLSTTFLVNSTDFSAATATVTLATLPTSLGISGTPAIECIIGCQFNQTVSSNQVTMMRAGITRSTRDFWLRRNGATWNAGVGFSAFAFFWKSGA